MINPKLIVAYIGGNCELTLSLSLNSIINDADKIVFIYDTNSIDKTKEILEQYKNKYPDKMIIIERRYEKEHMGANGRARNCYLTYCQQNFMDEYLLVLDPDEVVENPELFKKKAIELANNPENKDKFQTLHPRMRHFIRDLGHEDATVRQHCCLGRFFRIKDNLKYPEVEHPLVAATNLDTFKTEDEMFRHIYIEWFNQPCIWHLGYCKEMFDIYKKYKNHQKKSNMHTLEQLTHWKNCHILGEFPVSKVDILEVPKIIRDYFEVNPVEDKEYFKDREALQTKHFIDAITFKRAFNLDDKTAVLDIGCGPSQRVFALDSYGVDCWGSDVSEYIIDKVNKNESYGRKLFVDDITNWKDLRKWDIVICYDVMEHIPEDKIDAALDNLFMITDKVLFAITTTENGNIDEDKTHITKKPGKWWNKKLHEHGFILKSPPENFLNKEFIIIAEKSGTTKIEGWNVFKDERN